MSMHLLDYAASRSFGLFKKNNIVNMVKVMYKNDITVAPYFLR